MINTLIVLLFLKQCKFGGKPCGVASLRFPTNVFLVMELLKLKKAVSTGKDRSICVLLDLWLSTIF